MGHRFRPPDTGPHPRPCAGERPAARRAETLEEIRLYELRHAEAVSQAELAGRLDALPMVASGKVDKHALRTDRT